MSNPINLDVANAAQDGWTIPAIIEDAIDYAAHDQKLVTAEFIGQPLIENLKALLNGRVSSRDYLNTWSGAGLAAGDPVRISANDTVVKSLATTAANSAVHGFVRYASGGNVFIEHFHRKTGLAGGTAGGIVYLSNAGSYSATPGTVPRAVGIWEDATTALLFSAPAGGGSGSTDSIIVATVTYNLSTSESGATVTTEGAAGAASARPINLPAAAAGLKYQIYVDNTNGARVVAQGGNTIKLFDQTGAVNGYIENDTDGGEIWLLAKNAAQWIARQPVGDWDLSV